MPDGRHIVVAGAGIGGLTAALALAATGWRVTLLERAPVLSEIGAGIQIAPNAGRVLLRLGLDDAMAREGFEPAAIDLYSSDSGQRLATLRPTALRARYGFPYRVIHRADLQRLLADAARANPAITLLTGSPVVRLTQTADGVTAHVENDDGAHDVACDALIAADGIWSTLRQFVTGTTTPWPANNTAWRTILSADDAAEYLPVDRVGLWLGPDVHLVHYPVSRGTKVNLVAMVEEGWDHRGWSAAADGVGIQRQLADWARPIRRLVQHPAKWTRFALNTIDPRQSWCDGRVAMLGDAAHAMTPFLAQGAAMAIEDAAVLAFHLKDAGDIPAALRRYEEERKARVIRVHDISARTGSSYHMRGGSAVLRNIALVAGGERLLMNRTNWVYRWQPPEF